MEPDFWSIKNSVRSSFYYDNCRRCKNPLYMKEKFVHCSTEAKGYMIMGEEMKELLSNGILEVKDIGYTKLCTETIYSLTVEELKKLKELLNE